MIGHLRDEAAGDTLLAAERAKAGDQRWADTYTDRAKALTDAANEIEDATIEAVCK